MATGSSTGPYSSMRPYIGPYGSMRPYIGPYDSYRVEYRVEVRYRAIWLYLTLFEVLYGSI